MLARKKEPPYEPVVELPDTYIPAMYISGMNTPGCIQLLINREHFTIGADPENDGVISTESLGLSRKHAVIEYEGGGYSLTDLHSTNGTYLNGEWLVPETKTPIRGGDQIRFGMAVFAVEEIVQGGPK